MTLDQLDAQLRPHGWHAWKSTGQAYLFDAGRLVDGVFYATGPYNTEYAATVDQLAARVNRRLAREMNR